MSLPRIEPTKQYTVKDIGSWEGKWELIEGIPHLSASPSRLHQTVSRRLLTSLENYLTDSKSCEVFSAPFDVYLSESTDQDFDDHKNTVQPDLLIVCDPSKIYDRGIKGAPDWIAEIISPSTAKMDRLKKFNLYEKHGVQELWLISPYEQIIEIFIFDDNKRYMRKGVYGPDDQITLEQFEDFSMDVSELFRGFPIS